MDAGAAALADIGALDGVAELPLVHARPDGIAQRRHAGVAEGRADPQPVELLADFTARSRP